MNRIHKTPWIRSGWYKGEDPYPWNKDTLYLHNFIIGCISGYQSRGFLNKCIGILENHSESVSFFQSLFFLSVYLSFFLSIYLSFCLSIFLSVYLSFFLSIYLSVCLSFSLLLQEKHGSTYYTPVMKTFT